MGPKLRVAIAHVGRGDFLLLQDIMQRAGHEVVHYGETHAQMLQRCESLEGDLVIVGVSPEGDGGLTALKAYSEKHGLPVVLIGSRYDEPFLESAIACGILAYVSKPLREEEFVVALRIAAIRYQERLKLLESLSRAIQSLEDRKIVERAKGIVMSKRNLDEENAHKYLQRIARRHRRKLADVARSLVMVDLELGPQPTECRPAASEQGRNLSIKTLS